MEDKNKNSKEDLIILRNYTLGVAGFATAVSTILIQVFHFRTEPTIVCTIAFACMMLLIVYLIGKSENRSQKFMKEHIEKSDATIQSFDTRFNAIDKALIDIQASTLRLELNRAIAHHPENHDTIIRMAERYFRPVEQGGLGGNWYMASIVLDWAKKEKVELPAELREVVK